MKYDDGKGGQEEVLKGLMEPLLIAILCTLHLKHNVQSDHETAATSFSNPLPVSSRLQRTAGRFGVHLVREISPWSSQVLCIGLVKT